MVRSATTSVKPRDVLLAIVAITIGIIFEYRDQTASNKGGPVGPDIFPEWISLWDATLLTLVNPALVNPPLGMLFGLITHLGSVVAIVVLSTVLYLISHKREAVLSFTSLLLGIVIVLPLKMLILRPRPYSILETVIPLEGELDASFPSGHSERVFALAVVLSGKGFKASLPPYLLAFMIAFSRLFLGVHYPTDVLVGSVMGWVVGKVTLRIERKLIDTARFVRIL